MTPKTFTISSQPGTNITLPVSGLPYLPSFTRFVVTQKNNTAQGYSHSSIGTFDGTDKRCHSIFQDTAGGDSKRYTDRVIHHLDRVSGSIVPVIIADSVTYSQPSPGDYRVSIFFSTSVSGYKIDMEFYP
jgi:hypothetical protein